MVVNLMLDNMKKLFFLSALLIGSLQLVGCQHPESEIGIVIEPSHVVMHYNFPSQYVPKRTIRVWVPDGYTYTQKYDVLYMHDGQMLFNANTTWNNQEWGVDEAMDTLVNFGYIRPTIVVGIDSRAQMADRVAEYCPDDVAALLPPGKQLYDGLGTPHGNDYLRFLIEELKPFIDSAYSTYPDRDHTWIMGSSCGGLISSYALCKYPQVFAGAACMSTHSTLAADVNHPDPDAITAYRTYLLQHLTPNSCLLYFDRGDQTLDANYAESQDAINQALWAAGWDEDHFMYHFFPGAAHEEKYWRARIDIPLRFLLGK